MKLYLELSDIKNLNPPIKGKIINLPSYQYIVEIGTTKELDLTYKYFGAHPDFISGFIPNDDLIELTGTGLGSRWNKYEQKNYLSEEYLKSYHMGCKLIAEQIRKFAPDYVYLPLRGAMPIWRIVNKYMENNKPIEFTPATSSFVFYPKDRFGKRVSARHANILSIKRIKRDFKPGRIAYIDEIVSGSMMSSHLNEILKIIGNTDWEVGVFGLAEAGGTKFRADCRQSIENHFKNKRIKAFNYQPVKRLLGEDDRKFGGLHYLDYNKGPIVVPFLNNEKQYYKEYVMLDSFRYKVENL